MHPLAASAFSLPLTALIFYSRARYCKIAFILPLTPLFLKTSRVFCVVSTSLARINKEINYNKTNPNFKQTTLFFTIT
jgi:hypothetical protein